MPWRERLATMFLQGRVPRKTQTRLLSGVISQSRRQFKRRLTKRRMGKEKVSVTTVSHDRYAGPARIKKSWKGPAGIYRVRSVGSTSVPCATGTVMREIRDGTVRGHVVTTEGEEIVMARRKTEPKTDIEITDTNIDPDLGRGLEIGDQDQTDIEAEVAIASHRGGVILEGVLTTIRNVSEEGAGSKETTDHLIIIARPSFFTSFGRQDIQREPITLSAYMYRFHKSRFESRFE